MRTNARAAAIPLPAKIPSFAAATCSSPPKTRKMLRPGRRIFSPSTCSARAKLQITLATEQPRLASQVFSAS